MIIDAINISIYACVLEGDRSFSVLKTWIEDRNLVSEFKRRTTRYTDNFSILIM